MLSSMSLNFDYVLRKWQALERCARMIPNPNAIICPRPNDMTHPSQENRVS